MTEPNSVKAVLEQLAEAEKQRAEPNLSSKQRRARTVSRLAAVQALYQMELAGEGVETVIAEFSNHRFDADIEGAPGDPRVDSALQELAFHCKYVRPLGTYRQGRKRG